MNYSPTYANGLNCLVYGANAAWYDRTNDLVTAAANVWFEVTPNVGRTAFEMTPPFPLSQGSFVIGSGVDDDGVNAVPVTVSRSLEHPDMLYVSWPALVVGRRNMNLQFTYRA